MLVTAFITWGCCRVCLPACSGVCLPACLAACLPACRSYRLMPLIAILPELTACKYGMQLSQTVVQLQVIRSRPDAALVLADVMTVHSHTDEISVFVAGRSQRCNISVNEQ